VLRCFLAILGLAILLSATLIPDHAYARRGGGGLPPAVASGAAACMPDAFTAALDGFMVVAAGMLDGYIPGRRHAGAALLA
jgi:hypothetical protein